MLLIRVVAAEANMAWQRFATVADDSPMRAFNWAIRDVLLPVSYTHCFLSRTQVAQAGLAALQR